VDILKRIIELRDARNWTEYRLSEEANITQSTISGWFCKNKNPTISSLEKVCKAFGITLSQFFAEGEEPIVLTEEQRRMFDKWNSLEKEQKEAFLNLIEKI